jgi:SOS-response transcriptional repressor LexA
MKIILHSDHKLPFLGSIKAGFPTFVEEENDLISLEDYLTDNVHAAFMIKIKDDQLKNVGVLRGDLAVIERRPFVNVGDIVLVMINGKHRFLRGDMTQGKTVLKEIQTDNTPHFSTQVIGILKGIIRKY